MNAFSDISVLLIDQEPELKPQTRCSFCSTDEIVNNTECSSPLFNETAPCSPFGRVDGFQLPLGLSRSEADLYLSFCRVCRSALTLEQQRRQIPNMIQPEYYLRFNYVRSHDDEWLSS